MHTIVNPTPKSVVKVFADEVSMHLCGQDTAGRYCLFTVATPPGEGPPLHVHRNEDEWFFVLEGIVEFFSNGEWKTVPPGGVVFAPRNSIHTYRNVGTSPSKMIVHAAPAGLEIFFSECADVCAKPGPPEMQKILEISASHGIEFVND